MEWAAVYDDQRSPRAVLQRHQHGCGLNGPFNVTSIYVYGPGLAYAVDQSNAGAVYHTDGLGSVRAITDGSGNVVETYRTDAYGVPTSTQGGVNQTFQFAGQQRDENGLIDLRARMYDPTQGCFLQRDPLVGTPGLPLSLNPYSYALNNPINRTDPSGLVAVGPKFGVSSGQRHP